MPRAKYDENNPYNLLFEEMIQVHSLNTFQLAQFMAVFKNENIVNYQGARDCWYAAPRRNAKKKL